MEALWTELDPILDHLGGCDLSDSDATRRSLSEKFPALPALEAYCREHVDELCPKEAGGAKFGRGAKDRNGFSIDFVLSSGKGMKHTHPEGEINLCFAFEGTPTFDGHAPGWVVYGPNTTHPANVEGGSMFMIYFLPGGKIQWHR